MISVNLWCKINTDVNALIHETTIQFWVFLDMSRFVNRFCLFCNLSLSFNCDIFKVNIYIWGHVVCLFVCLFVCLSVFFLFVCFNLITLLLFCFSMLWYNFDLLIMRKRITTITLTFLHVWVGKCWFYK
jgi:hypothetical protein